MKPAAAPHGLRIVAAFEATKGAVVLLAGFAVFRAADHGVAAIVDALVQHLHLNPAKSVPRVFVEWLDNTSDRQLQALAAGAIVYAALRLAEAVGLWRARAWAEWLSIASGLVYVPFELAGLTHGASALKLALLAANLAVVVYMARVLRARHAAR